jgi:hypothetical protein
MVGRPPTTGFSTGRANPLDPASCSSVVASMLKAQLRSKIGALGPDGQDIEDILTGDFFGALDHLPRKPYLRCVQPSVAKLSRYANYGLLCRSLGAGTNWPVRRT